MLTYALISGLLYGLYFTLIGLGLNLVFGVMRIVNLAHGDIIVSGAFAAMLIFQASGASIGLAVPVTFVLFFVLGIVLFAVVIPKLQKAREPEMLSFIVFFGISQIIEALQSLAFGTSERSVPGIEAGRSLSALVSLVGVARPAGTPVSIAGGQFPAAWILTALASGVAVLATYAYLYHTKTGMLTRAVMADRNEAVASGIDVHRVSAIAFGVGVGLAAVAGVFAPFMVGSITPALGVDLTVSAFAVIIVGSLGSPLGTLLGGLIYGVSYMVMQAYLSAWTDLLPVLVVILVLLIKPNGLLGKHVRRA